MINRIITRCRIHQIRKLGKLAQTQVGIPKELHCEIEFADCSYSYYDSLPTGDFEDLKKRKIVYPLAKLSDNPLDILIHESTHRKQDIETLAWIQTELMAALRIDPIKAEQQKLFHEKTFKELVRKRWWNCISPAMLEEGADKAVLQKVNCYKCLYEATKYYRADLQKMLHSAQKAHPSLQTIEDYYDRFIKEYGHFPPSAFAEKTKKLKDQHAICSAHRHQKVYGLMLPLMLTYGSQ